MGGLAPPQRTVVVLACFEGLSQTEIAERMNAPLGTVKSWMRQALLKLRERVPWRNSRERAARRTSRPVHRGRTPVGAKADDSPARLAARTSGDAGCPPDREAAGCRPPGGAPAAATHEPHGVHGGQRLAAPRLPGRCGRPELPAAAGEPPGASATRFVDSASRATAG
jgi:hypothetical protein